MEITRSKTQGRGNQSSPTTSPYSNGSSNGSSLHPNPTPPRTPTPVFRSQETNPYPTTFIQADTISFKQVVQMLTGSSKTAKQTSKPDSHPLSSAARGGSSIPPIKSTCQKKQGFKLFERRNSLKNGLMLNTLIPGFSQNSGFSPRNPETFSPSILDLPSLVLSPITPLNEDNLSKSMRNSSEEEKAIAEKKFYFHPSPRTTPTDPEPRLLPLFPVTSPRVPGCSS